MALAQPCMQQRVWRLLVLVAVTAQLSVAAKMEEEPLIGWKGETYKPEYLEQHTATDSKADSDSKRPWVQVISWRPRAFIYHNFLSDAEAAHIIKLAAPQMKRSTVVGGVDGGVVDDIRTSAGTFLMRNQDPVVTAVEHRLALWSGLPPSYQEDMQVLRYGPTNKYGPHIDGLERVATVLIYLVPPEEGGETAFPQADQWLDRKMGEETQGAFSECAKGHVAYKPKRGDALLFYDVLPDYQVPDQYSMHTGCPVIKGVKWNAVKWLHGKPFREEDYNRSLTAKKQALPDPGECIDLDDHCKLWADSGECQKNAGYMLGSHTGQGACRHACGECEQCAPGDKVCFNKNRARGGYMTFEEPELRLAELGLPPGSVFPRQHQT